MVVRASKSLMFVKSVSGAKSLRKIGVRPTVGDLALTITRTGIALLSGLEGTINSVQGGATTQRWPRLLAAHCAVERRHGDFATVAATAAS